MFSRRNAAVFLVVALLTSATVRAAKITVVEDAIESDTSSVLLPQTGTGSILRRDCSKCNDTPLQVTKTSQFFFRKDTVSLEQLNAFIKQAKGPMQLLIFYRVGGVEITRVVVR